MLLFPQLYMITMKQGWILLALDGALWYTYPGLHS